MQLKVKVGKKLNFPEKFEKTPVNQTYGVMYSGKISMNFDIHFFLTESISSAFSLSFPKI
jgi:hypothetical protein